MASWGSARRRPSWHDFPAAENAALRHFLKRGFESHQLKMPKKKEAFQPLFSLAQRVGFEPTCGFPQTDFECYEQLAINGFLRSLWFAVLPPRKSPMCKLFLIKSQKSPNYSNPRDFFKRSAFLSMLGRHRADICSLKRPYG